MSANQEIHRTSRFSRVLSALFLVLLGVSFAVRWMQPAAEEVARNHLELKGDDPNRIDLQVGAGVYLPEHFSAPMIARGSGGFLLELDARAESS